MCLCALPDKGEELRAEFREFFKYKEELPARWNQAVDTLYDYFPERSAVNIFHESMYLWAN